MTDNSSQLPEFFDPSQQEGSNFDLLTAGVYPAQIIEASVSTPQSLDGHGIRLTWQITEGDYENRHVWQNITFQHSNTQAQEIGRRQLKDLCVACGITTGIHSLDPFKFIPCKIRVGIKKDKNGVYDDKNVVTRVWPASYEPPSSASGSRPPKPQAAWASPQTPPKSATASMEAAMAAAAARFATSSRASPQASPNGGTPPQTPPQTSSQDSPQNSSQTSPQTPPQASPQAVHGEEPWRG
jgi:hypothetical protein